MGLAALAPPGKCDWNVALFMRGHIVYRFLDIAAGAGGTAALARARSKTCRTRGGSLAREASWSAEREFRFGPQTTVVALLEEFCLTRDKLPLSAPITT